MGETLTRTATITSAPALAAALRETNRRDLPTASKQIFEGDFLAQMYQVSSVINTAGEAQKEVHAVVHVVGCVIERLHKLANAYGEWPVFDASAYFDLTEAQSAHLVRVNERVSTVHVVFFVDPILPSFQTADTFWAETFFPAYHTARPVLRNGDLNAYVDHFREEAQPQMIAHWQRLIDVIKSARDTLVSDIGFLTTNGAQEERSRHRAAWKQPPASGIAAELLPRFNDVPTLTLSFEFPLPAYRQSGRLQRLRRNRDRRRFRR